MKSNAKSSENRGFCRLKMQKYTKNTKKTQKNAKIFAHIKKKYYLCIEIKKQLIINPGGNGSQAAKKL